MPIAEINSIVSICYKSSEGTKVEWLNASSEYADSVAVQPNVEMLHQLEWNRQVGYSFSCTDVIQEATTNGPVI